MNRGRKNVWELMYDLQHGMSVYEALAKMPYMERISRGDGWYTFEWRENRDLARCNPDDIILVKDLDADIVFRHHLTKAEIDAIMYHVFTMYDSAKLAYLNERNHYPKTTRAAEYTHNVSVTIDTQKMMFGGMRDEAMFDVSVSYTVAT